MLWQSKREALEHIFGSQINLPETISLYPFVTWQKLLLYLSYAAFFLVTTDYIRTSKQIKRFFWIIFTVAMIESLIGLLQYIASGTKVPASGSYINPNHFAGLLLLVTPLFLGYLIHVSTKEHFQLNSWKQAIKAQSSSNLLLLFATTLIAISLILSQSRGAIFSFAAAMLFLYMLISLNKKSSTVKWLLGVFFVIIILYSFWIGLDPVIEKFSETEETLPLRTYLWKDTFKLIKDFPAFGTGLGTFSLAYTLYKEDAYWPYVYDHAHNDYLELAAETGLIGFFLVLFALISFYKRAVYNIRKFSPQKDPLRYYILLGCLSGMFGLFIHAVTEFNFQIPANAYYFIFLLGLANSLQYHLSERQN
jgi:O-antigen ligase